MMTKEEVLKQFGEGLTKTLEKDSKNKTWLAEAVGTQNQIINEYQKGVKDPQMYRVALIARALNVTVDELMTGQIRAKRKALKGEVLPAPEFYKELNKRLNMVLEQAKMNNNQLAVKTGINPGTTMNILNGKRKQPRLSTIAMMAAGMGANINQLIPDLVISESKENQTSPKTRKLGTSDGNALKLQKEKRMIDKQRVYNVIRKTEYCPTNETIVNISTFSTRAAANTAMKDYTDKAQQQLKLMIKQKTGEEVEPKVEAETDPKTGLTTGVTISLIMDGSTTPGIVDHWEVVPTIVDEDIEYHGEAQDRAKSADELINNFSEIFAWMKETSEQPGANVRVALPVPGDDNPYINLAIPKSANAQGMDDYILMGVEKTNQGYKLYLQATDDGDDTLLRMAKDERDIVKFLKMYLNQEE